LGYVTVTPLPAGTLFTETQSELDVSWVTYSVIVTINGTDFPVNFTAGDTQAAVIEKVPVGASLSASATIGVSAGGASLGYSSLVAATALPISIQPGENSITMWVQYPLECTMSSDAAGYGAAITGTAPAYYTNAGPTALSGVSAAATYEDTSTTPATTMYFAGWSLTDGGTPVISSSIPTGSYKGKLTLYATYSSCAVSINPGESWGANTPIIAEGDHLALTPVPAGFPSTPTYTWSIESPAADAPVTVSSSGVVSPVEGASGNATIKVTATCGAMTATATQSVTVAALSLDCNSTEVLTLDSADKTITASIAGYTGTDIEYTWSIPATTAVALMPGASGPSRMFHPFAGGKDTVSVSARITGVNKTLPVKTVDIYVLDLALSGGTALNAPTVPGGNYSLTMATTDTAGKGVTASLNGLSGVSGVTYTWTAGSSAADKIEFTGSSTDASRTVKPKNAGTAAFTVTASLGGVSTSATVDVSVAGIVFTLFPKSYVMGSSVANGTMLKAEIQGYSGTVTWGSWSSGTPAVATVGGGTDGATLTWTNMTAVAGGKTEISLTATVGGTTLTAKKEIYVLELELTSSATSGFSAPTASTDGSLLLTTADTTGATVSATLKGLPAAEVDYSWTPTSSTTVTATGTSTKNLTVTPKTDNTTGSQTFTVTATYDGESTTRSVTVTVAGLTLTGGDSPHVFNSAPDAPAGANDITLTLGANGVNIGDLSGVTYTSSNTLVAANPPTGADGCTVTALKGGKTTITVTATAGGKTLTATKDITVINLVVKDGDGNVVPATGNSLADGPVDLTAALEGITTGVTYAWTCTPATGAAVSITSTSGASTTVSGTSGSADIKATATYGGTNYEKTMAFSAGITLAELQTLLDNLDASTTSVASPYVLPPVVVNDASDLSSLKTMLAALNSSGKYVDLSATRLPDSITSLSSAFYYCKTMVKPPKLPNNVTDMSYCFKDCTGLTDLSGLTIPDSVTNMTSCFSGCTGLTNLSGLTIPDSVTSMSMCFSSCSNLTTAPVIPAGVTNLFNCFGGCTKLSGTVIVKANITTAANWSLAFNNVPAANGVVVKVGYPEVEESLSSNIAGVGHITVQLDPSILDP